MRVFTHNFFSRLKYTCNATMMNIFELTKMHKRKQQNRIKVYEELLAKCHKKIYEICKGNNVSECIYKVPMYTFGSPLYNQEAAIAYILLKLRKNSFDVYYEKPNILHISWDKHKQTYFYDSDVLLLENQPDKASEVLSKLNKQPDGSTFLQPPPQRQYQPQPPPPPQQQQRRYQQRRYQPPPPKIEYNPQYQIQYQQQQQQQQPPQQLTYTPQSSSSYSTDDIQDKELNSNSIQSMSYMTKYFKDLNQKYLTD